MEDLLPSEYYLSQNHPNPFRGKTIIKYCVPEEIRVKLEIFDDEKEKIKTLVDEVKEPGTYQVEFKPNGFTDGIYLCELTAGNVMLTRKMVLMK
jgi:hypothetical protein